MSTYAFDIWDADAPVLLVGGVGSFDIWDNEAPFVQEAESTEEMLTFLAAGDSTATVAIQALYQFSIQADGDSTASVSLSGTGSMVVLAAGDSTAVSWLTSTLLFAVQADGDSSASVVFNGVGAMVPAGFAGDSSAIVLELSSAPFTYPPTLIFGL
jgi:hypothetical protein